MATQKSLCSTLRAIGSLEVLYIDATANGANYGAWFGNANCPEKFEIIDVWCINNGGATGATTITIKNGSDSVTDAIDVNVADKTIVRAGTIDDTYTTLMPGGTISATSSSGTADADVYVLLMRVA